jgi:hypothetical protein
MSNAVESTQNEGQLEAIQDTVARLMDIRNDLNGMEEPVKVLKAEQKQCREKIQGYMEREDIGTFARVRGTHNITVYPAWAQQSLNVEFMAVALSEYIKEHGNRMEPEKVAKFVFQLKKDRRRRVNKLAVRQCPKKKESKKRKVQMMSGDASEASESDVSESDGAGGGTQRNLLAL